MTIARWGARELFLLSVFAIYSETYFRIIAVCLLVMIEIGHWQIVTALELKMEGLQLKLWMDELTWRTAYGKMQQDPHRDWDETIQDATIYAQDDINRARSDADLLELDMSPWLSVPLRFGLQIVSIGIDVGIVLLILPYFREFVGPLSF